MGKDIFTMEKEKEEVLTSTYELTLLVLPDLSEFDAQKVANKVTGMIINHNGQIIREHNWGKRRLAYHIKKTDSGYYQTIIFTAPKEAINEISHDMLLIPEILRYLSISLDKEGVVIDQLFTPEKELALVASMMKEKIEPKTRATRRSPRTVKFTDKDTKVEANTVTEETVEGSSSTLDENLQTDALNDNTDRLKELDEKLDQIFKDE